MFLKFIYLDIGKVRNIYKFFRTVWEVCFILITLISFYILLFKLSK